MQTLYFIIWCQLPADGIHDGIVAVYGIWRKSPCPVYGAAFLLLEKVFRLPCAILQKIFRLLYVLLVVYVENLAELTGSEVHSVGDECALEVAHSAFLPLHTSFKGLYGLWRESVYSSRNKGASVLRVVEACDAEVGVGGDIERFLVVDIVGHSHQSVRTACLHHRLKVADVFCKLLFSEDGVYGGKAEWGVFQKAAYLKHTVHGAWRRLHDEAQWHLPTIQSLALHLFKMPSDKGGVVVADYYYLLCPIVHKYSYQPVYQGFSVYADKRLWLFHPFACQPRPFSGCYYRIFHFCRFKKTIPCKVIVFEYNKENNLGYFSFFMLFRIIVYPKILLLLSCRFRILIIFLQKKHEP